MSLSNYAGKKILELIVGKTTFTLPTAYIGLSATDPLNDGSGLAEPVGGGYARAATVGNDWNNAISGGASGADSIDNANAVTFPTATASWGTVAYFVIFDAMTAGNILGSGKLVTAVTINNGDTKAFDSNQLSLTQD